MDVTQVPETNRDKHVIAGLQRTEGELVNAQLVH